MRDSLFFEIGSPVSRAGLCLLCRRGWPWSLVLLLLPPEFSTLPLWTVTVCACPSHRLLLPPNPISRRWCLPHLCVSLILVTEPISSQASRRAWIIATKYLACQMNRVGRNWDLNQDNMGSFWKEEVCWRPLQKILHTHAHVHITKLKQHYWKLEISQCISKTPKEFYYPKAQIKSWRNNNVCVNWQNLKIGNTDEVSEM